MRVLVFLAFCSLLVWNNASAQETFTLKKDLRSQWRIFKDNQFVLFDPGTGAQCVYFQIDAAKFPTDHLLLKSSKPFFLFMNGKLMKAHTGHLELPLDSLSTVLQQSRFDVSVYQKNLLDKDLQTLIVNNSPPAAMQLVKPHTYFRDFIIIAGLVIIIFFVTMLRVHPKLASDYFSVARILSLREAEDTQLNSRFALSSNILFYVFSSLLVGLCLMILFNNMPEGYRLPYRFLAISFWGIFFQWIKISLIILSLMFAKITLIFALSNLFGLRNVAAIHFFNWIRLLLIVAGSLSTMVFIYYISRGYNTSVYIGVLVTIVIALSAWNVIAFLKLNNRIEHSMFHLFSYICATEIIPLLITIRVLFQ